MADEIVVGMGRLLVVNEPVLLTCLGLGSCVGVMIYDEEQQVAGLAHIMLPDSSNAKFTTHEQSSLLAENDEYCLQTFKHSLTQMGYEIKDIAKTYDEVIEKYKKLDPYLFLLDFDLSKENTGKLVNEIFGLNKTANIVVANAENSPTYLDLLNNGVLDVITKPVTKKKVELTLDIINSLRHLRFADVAIEKMLNKMYSMGCQEGNLKAKVVGGANMFTHSQVSMRNIGKENTEKALEVLHENNVHVVSKSVGGTLGRTVRFNTRDYSAEITNRDGKTRI